MDQSIRIESLSEALKIIGQKCFSCQQNNLSGGYYHTRRDVNSLIYQCSLGIGSHDLVAKVFFESSPVQIKDILKDISNMERGKRPELYRKLEVAAKLLPENLEYELNGRCYRCSGEALLHIRERKIIYECENCKKSGQESYDAEINSDN
ncbi:hypothetical protein HYT56_04185 [Candidatus Woesearchaeota archaeon]|nr:hypothetical protein [Candidatus Woesearchaeota archaeon]